MEEEDETGRQDKEEGEVGREMSVCMLDITTP